MIFTRFYIDNLYNFSQAELDLTFQRALKRSVIEGEFLKGRPKIKFKKVCILSGANATGKTSLAKVIWHISKALTGWDSMFSMPNNSVNHQDKPAVIEAEFITPNDYKIYSFKLERSPNTDLPSFSLASIPILKQDTITTLREKLADLINETAPVKKDQIYISSKNGTFEKNLPELEKIKQTLKENWGWYYIFSHTVETENTQRVYNFDLDIFKRVLMTLDTSIADVIELHDKSSRIQVVSIKFKNGDTVLIDEQGRIPIQQIERLSKGTYDGIQIADMLTTIIQKKNIHNLQSSYYLDEKMAYYHPTMEIAFLNLMIQKLGRHDQLFYTTHNNDVLDMRLPIHSFAFIKKEEDQAIFIQPERQLKKNDRSLLPSIKNDLFGTLPDTSGLDVFL